ncbi:MAG: topoisomerase [Solirubrobacterales bacterium]|jgi:DNA topoisomerase IB|nr:topoisomerase [Solirubrobacterales bacterium]
MPRLRRIDCSGPGISRRRRGRGFEYLREDGRAVRDRKTLARIGELAIPPAWKDVWICLDPFGHIQATGIDAAGRKQYLYHDTWHERRGREKFDQTLDFGRKLPKLRKRLAAELAGEELDRAHVLACAVRLLDLGFFRIGSERYVELNETYGLATLRKDHVTIADHQVSFDFPAKSGQRRVQSIVDDQVLPVIKALKRRRAGGPELLAYRRNGGWADVRSTDINEYIKELSGGDFSAKDFRTWNATVLAAVNLAAHQPKELSPTARKRRISDAVKVVSEYLGNTPAVCRRSYIDPRVFDRFDSGETIGPALGRAASRTDDFIDRETIERAVIRLID